MSNSTARADIRRLLNLIGNAVDALEDACDHDGTEIPNLNDPFQQSSEAFRSNAVVAEAANVICAAAAHLQAILAPPYLTFQGAIAAHTRSHAARICLESNVTEIIREKGPLGLHVSEISKYNGQDPQILGRCLRYLSSLHIYREVSPNVFANNRISSMLDTTKEVEALIKDPKSKHIGTSGLPAYFSYLAGDPFLFSAKSWEYLSAPAHSDKSKRSVMQHVYDTDQSLFECYSRPENLSKLQLFGLGMKGVSVFQPANAIFTSFAWESLPPNAVVVDVGGGIGTSALQLIQKFPKLKIVIQDLPSVIEGAKQFWGKQMPEALSSGQIELQAQNFFEPQPRKDADVFLLKHILHAWSDEKSVEILNHLRKVAKKDTKLLVLDCILPMACRAPKVNGNRSSVPGSVSSEAPEPLLANYGVANEMCYTIDMIMMLNTGTPERTFPEMENVLANGGWKVVKVNRNGTDNTIAQGYEAVLI